MDNKLDRDAVSIPYFVHEGDMDRALKTNGRLIVALILTIVLMFASNALWLYEWTQYDYSDEEITTTSYEQDGSGINVIGNRNEVNNGPENNSYQSKTESEVEDQKTVTREQDQK